MQVEHDHGWKELESFSNLKVLSSTINILIPLVRVARIRYDNWLDFLRYGLHNNKN